MVLRLENACSLHTNEHKQSSDLSFLTHQPELFKIINMDKNIHAVMKHTDNIDMTFCNEIKNNVPTLPKIGKAWYYVIN